MMATKLLCRLGQHKWQVTGPDDQHLVLRCSACAKTKPLARFAGSHERGGDGDSGAVDWGA